MNTKKGFAIIAVAILLIAGIIIVSQSIRPAANDGTISFTDSYGRKISMDHSPERVAVVNTDIAYYMQILDVENKVVGMDTDGLEKMLECSDRYGPELIDFGKRGAFSTSTTIEKLLLNKVDCVLTPTSMGIGMTVLADVIENNGIKVVYLNAYGNKMLDTMDMMVTLFGATDQLKEKAAEYKSLFNSYIDKAKIVCPTKDPTLDYVYYMSSSSGTVGYYYVSTSELDGIVSSISGTNRAQTTSGSFSQYTREALAALFFDSSTPVLDFIFIRGTDDYTIDQVMDIFDSQGLPTTYTVGDYRSDNAGSVETIYVNTHIVSGMMCCFSYLVYAYAFTDGLQDADIDYIDSEARSFMTKYGFDFVISDSNPICRIVA